MKALFSLLRFAIVILAIPVTATAAAVGFQAANADWSDIELPSATETINVATSPTVPIERNHTIRADETGMIQGRIVTMDEQSSAQGIGQLSVSFIQRGVEVATGVTSSDGSFSVKDLLPGVYSFVAHGDGGLVILGVNVLPFAEGQTPVGLDVMAITSKPHETLQSLASSNSSTVVSNGAFDNAKLDLEVTSHNTVVLENDTLIGNVHSLYGGLEVDGTTITVAKNGEAISTTTADATGAFALGNIKPGIYELVASGPAGCAALTIEAIESTNLTIDQQAPAYTATESVYQDFVQEPSSYSYSNDIVLAPMDNYSGGCNSCGDASAPLMSGPVGGGCNTCGGGPVFASGAGGGRLGGGLGGGSGKLIAAAGITLTAVALSNNRRNNGVAPSSPVRP